MLEYPLPEEEAPSDKHNSQNKVLARTSFDNLYDFQELLSSFQKPAYQVLISGRVNAGTPRTVVTVFDTGARRNFSTGHSSHQNGIPTANLLRPRHWVFSPTNCPPKRPHICTRIYWRPTRTCMLRCLSENLAVDLLLWRSYLDWRIHASSQQNGWSYQIPPVQWC